MLPKGMTVLGERSVIRQMKVIGEELADVEDKDTPARRTSAPKVAEPNKREGGWIPCKRVP